MRRFPRIIPAVVLGGIVAGAMAGPAAAAPPKTPKVPVTIDGKRVSAKHLSRHDGRLYLAAAKKGTRLVGFTQLDRYSAYLRRTAGLKLKRGSLEQAGRRPARASWFGAYADFFEHGWGGGSSFRTESGYAVANLMAVRRGCGLFGCAGDFNNQISSVRTQGQGVLLYDGFDFGASTLYLPANQSMDLWGLGWSDRASSLRVYW